MYEFFSRLIHNKTVHYVTAIIIILYCQYLSAFYFINGDVGFNTDLARDFLLLENIVDSNKIPLIGARSGGIGGFFHGPLWLYINLPAYILGKGNPLVIGWFWLFLSFLLSFVVYFYSTKIFDYKVGLLSAVAVTAVSITNISSLFNPFGAVLVSFIYFYYFYLYLTKNRKIYLLMTFLLLGILIQFQIAFGGPILILTFIFVLIKIIKRKEYKHLLVIPTILIPLSTYLLFEIRHDFLQIRSVWVYFSSHDKSTELLNVNPVFNRLNGIINSLTITPYPHRLLSIFLIMAMGLIFYKLITQKIKRYKMAYILFFFLFVGYWILTFLFKGVIWGYYYWPFIPIVAVIFCSGFNIFNKKVFLLIYVFLIVNAIYVGQLTNKIHQSYIGNDAGSWKFNYSMAEIIFSQKDKEFGFYILSPDEFGYSPRYAINYLAKINPDVKIYPYSKKAVTYLLISSPGEENGSINGTYWKDKRVRINSQPVKNWKMGNGFIIEKYQLSDKEIAIPSDPNLINSIFFR